MKELVESIGKQIDTDKEVINILPRNGIKAIKTLLEAIQEMTAKYEYVNEMLLKDIENRFDELTAVDENEEIPKIEVDILKYNEAVKNTDKRSSYDKMGLDKISYNINGYYKSNLDRLNKELINCVKQFEGVGIKLTANEFNISEYSKEYMEVLLQEAQDGQINSERVKDAFEKVYWKCSEVVSHLYVNIKYIYDKYESEIDKFYKNKSEEVLQEFNATAEQIENKRTELIKQKKKLEDIDNKITLDKFYTGSLNINDYKEDNYKRMYTELTSKEISDLSETEKAEMDENIEKLDSNLGEYSKYCEYRFLVDGVLSIREEELKKAEANKDKKVKKTEFDIIKENIKKLATEIFKINEKLDKPSKGFFKKKSSNDKKNTAVILQRNNLILDLKKAYMELDEEIIKQNIIQNIDETSSLLDVLKLASNYYGFMARSMIKKNEEITDTEIGELAKEIRDFINFSNFAVINYVKISETKDLAIIIKDKYKLFGLQVSKENFQDDNVEDLIRKVKLITNYNNIQKTKFSVGDLEYITTVKEMLKK